MLIIIRVKLFYIKNNVIFNKVEVFNICNDYRVIISCKILIYVVYVLV